MVQATPAPERHRQNPGVHVRGSPLRDHDNMSGTALLLLSSAKCYLRRGTYEYRSRSRFKIRDAELCRSRNAPENTVAEVLSLPPLPLFGSASDCATTADRNPGVAPLEANAVFRKNSEPPLANFRPRNRQLLALSAMVSCFGCGARVRVGEVTRRLCSHGSRDRYCRAQRQVGKYLSTGHMYLQSYLVLASYRYLVVLASYILLL